MNSSNHSHANHSHAIEAGPHGAPTASPPSPIAAAIDIGSNSVLCLVGQRTTGDNIRPIADRCRITRLGRGLESTMLMSPEAISATLAAMEEYMTLADSLGAAKVVAVATAAVRKAKNRDAFLAEVARKLGIEVRVLSGAEEAKLTAKAVAATLAEFARNEGVVVDLGGGSTEVAHLVDGTVKEVESLQIGVVSLTERHLLGDAPGRQRVETAVHDAADVLGTSTLLSSLPGALPAAGVGGSATTLATLLAMEEYDGDRVHGTHIDVQQLTAVISQLQEMPSKARAQLPGLPADRSEVILAGAVILREALRTLGASRLTVSDRGLRWGVLIETIDQLTTSE